MTSAEVLKIIAAGARADESDEAFIDRVIDVMHEAGTDVLGRLGRSCPDGTEAFVLIARVARLPGQKTLARAARRVLAKEHGLELIFRGDRTTVRSIIVAAMRKKSRQKNSNPH